MCPDIQTKSHWILVEFVLSIHEYMHILRFICYSFLNVIQFAVVYVKEFQCQNTANFSAAHLKCCKLIKRNKVSKGIS